MLSKQSRPLIEQSVPLLREHGVTITRLFYQEMFSHYPELRNLFNMSNQAQGEQQQALANALYAYAANLEQPQLLDPILNRIAHKHASLHITPAQYTIVGKYLLGAVAEVLGELATPDILAAWDEVYWLFATDLIAREARLYADTEQKQLASWQTMRVIDIQRESQDVVSIYFEPEDGRRLPEFHPGQYVSVALYSDALRLQQIRQYSLSDSPEKPYWRITVKHAKDTQHSVGHDGIVSTQLHNLLINDTFKVSASYGDFTLDETSSKPVVCISAGVGLAPMISMINSLEAQQSQRTVRLVHGARNPKDRILLQDIQQADYALEKFEDIYFYNECESTNEKLNEYPGLMDLTMIKEHILLDNAHYYLCGSLPFMRDQRRALLNFGIDPVNIHYEVFGPDLLTQLQ